MAQTVMLADVPVGASFLLGARMLSKGGGSAELALFTAGVGAHGQLTIANDLTITGTLTDPPNQIPVVPVKRRFSVGDVVVNDSTSETMVVRNVWFSDDGFYWSNTTGQSPTYSTDGWSQMGTATLS